MQTFLEWGEILLSSISEIGDYLLMKPFTAYEILDNMGWLLHDSVKEVLLQNPEMTLNLSIGQVLLGGSLVGLLAFKLIKFFTDLIL